MVKRTHANGGYSVGSTPYEYRKADLACWMMLILFFYVGLQRMLTLAFNVYNTEHYEVSGFIE